MKSMNQAIGHKARENQLMITRRCARIRFSRSLATTQSIRKFSACEREEIQNKVIDVLRDVSDTFSSLLEKAQAASSDFITNSIFVCMAQLLAPPPRRKQICFDTNCAINNVVLSIMFDKQ